MARIRVRLKAIVATFIILLGVMAWSQTKTTKAERELGKTVELLEDLKELNKSQQQHLVSLLEQIRQLGAEPVVAPASSPTPTPRPVARRISRSTPTPVPGPSGPLGPPGPSGSPGPNPSPRPTCAGPLCLP